jgi:serine/threonine protein kinase
VFSVFNCTFGMQAYSTVGTPDYIAPEVLLKKGYGMECDWLVFFCNFVFIYKLIDFDHPLCFMYVLSS